MMQMSVHGHRPRRSDPDWVKNRRITLNYDGGTLDKLSKGQGKVPYILRRRGESLSATAGYQIYR